jgi:phage shock protein C
MKTQLTRSMTEKKIAGVAGGLAEAFGWDVSFVRLGFVLLTLLHGGGVLLYALLWLVMPRAGERSALQTAAAEAQQATSMFQTGDRSRTAGIALIGIGVLLVASALHLPGPIIALALLGGGWYLLKQR